METSAVLESFLARMLLLLLILHLEGCSFGEIKAYDESYVPDTYLVKAWKAKGQWLLAELLWHDSAIVKFQSSDSNQKSVEVHKTLLKERKAQLKSLLDDMQWGSIRLRQNKEYSQARALETTIQQLTLKLYPPSTEDKAKAASARRSAQANARERIAQQRTVLFKLLEGQIAAQAFEELFNTYTTLKELPYGQDRIDPRLEDARNLLDSRVEELDRSATQAYRLGDVKEAIDRWSEALKYSPENLGIAQKLQRAQKVSEKLDAIRSSN